MIARALLMLLGLEALAYLVLARTLAKAQAGPWCILGAIITIFVLVRVVVPLVPFMAATACRALAGAKAHHPAWLVAHAKETFAKSYFYSVAQPFERWIMGLDPEPAAGDALPVLLVHGYLGNRGQWHVMRSALSRRVPNPFFTIDLEPPLGALDGYWPQLEARIQEICAGTGSARLVIVAFSMGGLVTRACLARGGGERDRVAKVITLGTPHHGTFMAAMGPGQNARQMRPSGAWLAQLEADERARSIEVPITSIYAENDDIVVPQESSRVAVGRNIPLPAIGHMSLLLSPRVTELLVDELRAVNGP